MLRGTAQGTKARQSKQERPLAIRTSVQDFRGRRSVDEVVALAFATYCAYQLRKRVVIDQVRLDGILKELLGV